MQKEYFVNIVFENEDEDTDEHVWDIILADDRMDAFETCLEKRQIHIQDVWSQVVIEVSDDPIAETE